MAKGAPFKKGQKFCCFCWRPGVCDEHFWPEWSHGNLPKGPPGYTKMTFLRTPTGHIVSNPKSRPGAPKDIKIKHVCKACNNGWMGTLEEEVRVCLEPMMKLELVELTAAAQRTLAEYFTLKVMIADRISKPESPAFTTQDRHAFYRERTIPDGVSVAVLRYVAEPSPNVGQFNKETAKGVDPETGDLTRLANFTIRFAAVFIQVLSLPETKAEIKQHTSSGFIVFPPQFETVLWPPPMPISTAEAYHLQFVLTDGIRSRNGA